MKNFPQRKPKDVVLNIGIVELISDNRECRVRSER